LLCIWDKTLHTLKTLDAETSMKFLRFSYLIQDKMLFKHLVTVFLCFISLGIFAQDNWDNIKVINGDEGVIETMEIDLHDSPEFSQKYLERSIPSLNTEYTGYAIELITSDFLLSPSNSAFSGFGRIYMNQTANEYQYLFLVDYQRRKSVKQFYRKIVKPKAPNSKVVQYLNGVKTTEFSW